MIRRKFLASLGAIGASVAALPLGCTVPPDSKILLMLSNKVGIPNRGGMVARVRSGIL